MIERTLRRLILSLFYIFIFTILWNNSLGYLDADFGWHLKTGQEISESGQIPEINTKNYTLDGESWVDHEWLSNLLIFAVYDKFGYPSLTAAFACLMVIALLIQFYTIKKFFLKGRGFRFDLLIITLQFLGTLAMLPHLGIRVQEITILFLQILFLILLSYDKSRKKSRLIFLPFFFWFWSNLHGGFLIGYFVIFLWLAAKASGAILKRFPRLENFIQMPKRLERKEAAFACSIFVLSFLATFLTPYGYHLYSFLFGYKDTYYLMHIAEWLPAFYLPIIYPQWAYITFAVFSVLMLSLNIWVAQSSALAAKKNDERHFSIWFILLFLAFLFFALRSKRHFPLFFILTAPFVIQIISDEIDNLLRIIKPKITAFLKFSIMIGLMIILPAFSIQKLKWSDMSKAADPFGSYCQRYPCQAIDFLKNEEKLKNLRLFNYYGWGGFMIWTWPEKKLFIDGRLPQFEFNGHSILEEYYDFFKDKNGLAKLDGYSIDLVMINNKFEKFKLNWFEKHVLAFDEEELNTENNELKEELSASPVWEKIYNDDICSIFVRRSAF